MCISVGCTSRSGVAGSQGLHIIRSEHFAKVAILGTDFQVICGKICPQITKLASELVGYLNTDFHCSTFCLSGVVSVRVCMGGGERVV